MIHEIQFGKPNSSIDIIIIPFFIHRIQLIVESNAEKFRDRPDVKTQRGNLECMFPICSACKQTYDSVPKTFK